MIISIKNYIYLQLYIYSKLLIKLHNQLNIPFSRNSHQKFIISKLFQVRKHRFYRSIGLLFFKYFVSETIKCFFISFLSNSKTCNSNTQYTIYRISISTLLVIYSPFLIPIFTFCCWAALNTLL